jgi:hypothetical protein
LECTEYIARLVEKRLASALARGIVALPWQEIPAVIEEFLG